MSEFHAASPSEGTQDEIIQKFEVAFEQSTDQFNISAVRNIITNLRQSGLTNKEEQQLRSHVICRLRAEGCANKQIARALILPLSSVAPMITRLIIKGKLKRRYVTRKKNDELKDQIIKLRKNDYSKKEIAHELKCSVGVIGRAASELVAEGKIMPFSRGRKAGYAFWYNLADNRAQTIIKMVKEGATLREIGNALGCTHEWVRQIIDQMRETHGEVIVSYLTVFTEKR